MPPKYKSTNVSTNVKFREKNLLENFENVDSVRKVMFKKVTVETMETGSNSVRNSDYGSHQI